MTFEDKVAQRAIAMVLDAVYEQDFLSCSYGFRPGRSAHQALRQLLIMSTAHCDYGSLRIRFLRADAKGSHKPMIVAFARKLIIALWRYVNTGLLPEGFVLKPAA